jgi:hypothetical protein
MSRGRLPDLGEPVIRRRDAWRRIEERSIMLREQLAQRVREPVTLFSGWEEKHGRGGG